jgi:hypothetical protein
MIGPNASITVVVDPTNPGQFFACCGLLELADRLWPGAEGWFRTDPDVFNMSCNGTLSELIKAIANAKLDPARPDDPYATPIVVGEPFRSFTVDWWETDLTGGKDLKIWAGTMESFGIATAMQHALRDERFREPNLFDVGQVVNDPGDPKKKKEPYYFDSRRANNAHSRDTGFSANDLQLKTTAYPAVELLALIGLQVARPAFTSELRVYEYFTWTVPLPSSLLLPASSGALDVPGKCAFRFENGFRTGQKKHKAFRPAVPLTA